MDSLDKLRALCDAATPGPWEVDGSGIYSKVIHKDYGRPWLVSGQVYPNDGDFIAAARTALPALIELCEALEKKDAARDGYVWKDPAKSKIEWLAEYKAATAAVEAAQKNLENI